MFDPIIAFVKGLIAFVIGRFVAGVAAIKGFFLPPSKDASTGTRARYWAIRYGIKMLILFAVFIWTIPLLWHASYIRGFDLAYPKEVIRSTTTHSGDEQVEVGGDAKTPRTGDRSMLVDMMIYLIDFSVNKNEWMPSMPQYKFGFFGFPYEDTPFLDNKASFQHGVMIALRRTAVELNDSLGRVRSSSQADKDLQMARGNLQYDDETYWFNPFDDRLPFGPVQPSPQIFRKSLDLYKSFNDRLEKGDALYDTRSDNLRQYLDRISKDLGSVVDQLSKRTTAWKYDPRTDEFVAGEGNNRGWFDFNADNLYYEALGQMYAYHGLLQAAREDFKYVIETRGLTDVWDRLEEHVAEAAALSPLIVSNGSRDGFLMPAHLATMSESILRARVNMDEIQDVIGK
jgi:hypothetical protein